MGTSKKKDGSKKKTTKKATDETIEEKDKAVADLKTESAVTEETVISDEVVGDDEEKVKTVTITRKIQIIPIGDNKESAPTHEYIKNAQEVHYRAKNLLMGHLGATFYKNGQDLNKCDFRHEVLYLGTPSTHDITYPTGLDLRSLIIRTLKSEFSQMVRQGLPRGERNISNFKKTNPVPTNGRNLKFSFEFDETAAENYKSDPMSTENEINLLKSMKVKLKWVNGKNFVVNPGQSIDLRRTLFRIYTGEYKFGCSKIQTLTGRKDKKELDKLMLLLSVQKPVTSFELDPEVCVGVDIGAKNPAVCALNTDCYDKKYCGDNFAIKKIHATHSEKKKEYQSASIFNCSKHGRTKKLKRVYGIRDVESNTLKTMNHTIANQIIEFALAHKAKYINIENLEGFYDSPENNEYRKLWSYYGIQEKLKQKAKYHGIIVREVESNYTSQICGFCGSNAEGQLVDRDTFICKNPDCISRTFPLGFVESDFNAARNIAKSVKKATKKKETKEKTDGKKSGKTDSKTTE